MNTRNSEEIQEALNEYTNLSTISRDRGFSYKSVSKECYHVADRFHLVMNLSDAITKEIKHKIPRHINLTSIKNETTDVKSKNIPVKYTEKQKEKQKLIQDIKNEAKKGTSYRSIAKKYGIDRKTVTKYIRVKDVEQASVYDISNRKYSYFDPYKDEIIKLYLQTKNISEVYRQLKKKEIILTYSNLKHYISKINGSNIYEPPTYKKISRSQVIKYIFDWNYKDETGIYIHETLQMYPILKIYKSFYKRFKQYLVGSNVLCFLNLLSCWYEDNCLNKFIASLKTDWEAVLNSASCSISNGVTEGNVNKIKQIKRDMYGRASYELLRKKVIYQSLFS